MIASSISAARSRGRNVVELTWGRTHGPITRLMSPGDLGELVKPFVFLDYFETPSSGGPQMPDHPHSGIATHTTLLQGSTGYRDSTGKSGTLRAGSIEWMQAGGGVWHGGDLRPGEPIRGYQLWVALPTSLELQPAFSQYLNPEAVESDGRARILLGSHGKLRSPIADVSPMTYVHVQLRDGETWHISRPRITTSPRLAVNQGKLHVAGAVVARQMAVMPTRATPRWKSAPRGPPSSSSARRPSIRIRSSAVSTPCTRRNARSSAGRMGSGGSRARSCVRRARVVQKFDDDPADLRRRGCHIWLASGRWNPLGPFSRRAVAPSGIPAASVLVAALSCAPNAAADPDIDRGRARRLELPARSSPSTTS